MANPFNRINSMLKTKEDIQSFVLVTLILFVLFVKCYVMFADVKVHDQVGSDRKADIAKTQANANS